jgi:hypothetical protein
VVNGRVDLHRITESYAWTEDVQHLQPTHNVPSPRPSPSPSPVQYRPSLEPYNVLTPLANPEATFACQTRATVVSSEHSLTD